jgi:hypothetical protein
MVAVAVLLCGFVSLVAGVVLVAGAGWAAVVAGVVLMAFGLLADVDR